MSAKYSGLFGLDYFAFGAVCPTGFAMESAMYKVELESQDVELNVQSENRANHTEQNKKHESKLDFQSVAFISIIGVHFLIFAVPREIRHYS